jgi:hypothetical protein
MRTKFYIAVAYGTLVVDAYLALACAATKATPYVNDYLPPFRLVGGSDASRILVLGVATWTAILATGCLRAPSERREDLHGAGILWFVFVLAFIWLLLLLPLLVSFAWKLFIKGG